MALVQFVDDSAPYLNAQNLNNNFEYLDTKTDTYSTSETKTNKVWIDGKPIYRKVLQGGAISANSSSAIYTQVSNIDKILNTYGWGYDSNNSWFPLSRSHNSSFNYCITYYYYNTSNRFEIQTGSSVNLSATVIIMEYTKTTD